MEDRKVMWCPLMKEKCYSGWAPSMGEDPNTHERHICRFWIKLMGQNPQTGKPIDEYDCSIAWLPTLMVEQCRLENSVGAAVESLRNRTAEVRDQISQINQKSQSPLIPLNEVQSEQVKEIEQKDVKDDNA